MTYLKYVIPFLIYYSSLSAITSTWTLDADGNWATATPANWSAGVPNAVDDVAQFLGAITAARAVSLSQPTTVGTIELSNANAYTIMSNTLNFQTSVGNAALNIPSLAGAHVISSAVTLSSNLTVDHNVASSVTMSGAISGAGGITKTGNNGQLILASATPNTYTGLTTINTTLAGAGITLLSGGVPALPGNALISFGTLTMGAANQIGNSSTVTIGGASATFALGAFSQTIGSLNYQAGGFTAAAGALTLTSNTTTLTVRDVTINPDLIFTGSGDIVMDPTLGGTATIAGTMTLGNFLYNVNVPATVGIDIQSVVSGPGGIRKTGGGLLQFTTGSDNTYLGVTNVAGGTLSLERAGGNTVPGDLFINGGTLQYVGNGNQINDSATMILQSGTFAMGGFDETIDRLDFIGGLVTGLTGTLTLASPSTALQMSGGTTLSGGTVALSSGTGGVTFDPSINGTATIQSGLSLVAGTHPFSIGEGGATPDMQITGVISGAGGVTKTGGGTVDFAGGTSNSYTGTTIVNGGTLRLNKTGGAEAIVGPGAITVNAGALELLGSEQIADTLTMTINNGTFAMNGNTESIATLIYNGGSVAQSGGRLNLTSASNALTMRNTVIDGFVTTTAGGTIVFDPASGGSAVMNGSLALSAVTTFDIGGSAPNGMIINSTITSGGINKIGTGTLILNGVNSFTGTTTVSAGVLQGNTLSFSTPAPTLTTITAPGVLVFDQTFDGTFLGTLAGTGDMIKQRGGALTFPSPQVAGGTTTVTDGSLIVNSTFGGAGPLLINSGGTLGGVGTISKDVTVSGTLAPGDNGIGTINIVGSLTLAAGSTLESKINATTSDLVSITGPVTIASGSTFNFIPQPDLYVVPLNYTVVSASGGVTGTFSNVIDPFPLFFGTLSYLPNLVLLQVSLLPVSSLASQLDTNAAKVAQCLDARNPPPGSDLYGVINALRFVSTVEAINKALLQMQPSLFTSLAVIKESSTLYFRNAIYSRIEYQTRICGKKESGYHYWVAPLIGVGKENNHGAEPGYNVLTPGVAIGMDGFLTSELQLGGSLGYTNSNVTWKSKRGTGRVQGVYGAVYGRYDFQISFLESAVMGGYDHYSTQREIRFGGLLPFHRHAKAQHNGFEASAHLKGGLKIPVDQTHLNPFMSFDFLYLYEGSFNERGANSLNLKVSSKHANFLQSELGIHISHCLNLPRKTITPYIQASGIWESRFHGNREESCFGGCSIDVNGYYPSRGLVGAGGGFDVKWPLKNALKASFNYLGKYGLGFQDHSFNLELIY